MRVEKRRFERTTLVEKEFFIAEDGTEFEQRWDCINYERTQARKEGEGFLITKPEVEGRRNIDGGEYPEDRGYYWYFVRNEADAEILNRIFNPDYDDFVNYIGKWVCVEESDDSSWISSLDDGIEYAKKLLEDFGYNVQITRKEEA